jgi:hemoglobin/transferrin/lactoferrin receptor protein
MKYLLLISTLLLCVVETASGQSTIEKDTLTTSYLDELVVSANRWEQGVRELSSRVVKINTSTIQLQNPQTAADLLGLSNQAFIQKSQLGGGSPMIRGFATNRVLLVVDGVRMNNAIFRGGNVQNVISLDANNIREAEVIFGPGSVIYGSDAIGGVMDFHTLRPELSSNGLVFSGTALARYSSANHENTGHVNFSVGSKKWAFTTSITKLVFDDLKMGSHGPEEYTRPDYQMRDGLSDVTVENPDPNVQVETGYQQLNAMQKIRFKPNNDWEVTYGFHYSKTSDVPRYDRLILKNTSQVFTSAEWYYGPQKWILHALTAVYSKPTPISDQMKVTVGYQQYNESRHNRNFSGSNRNRLTERFESVDAWSFNLDADKQLSSNVSLFYGAELVTNNVGSTAQRVDITNGDISPVSTRYPNGSDWRSWAVYASARYRASERITLNASGRFTHVYTYAPFDRTFFDFPFTETTLRNGSFNASLGAAFHLTSDFKLYYNLSTGFRAPNIDDMGRVFDSQPGSVVVPNPELKPEIAYSAEIGFTGIATHKLSIDFAFYYTLLDNAIIRSTFLFNGADSIDYDGTLSQVLALQNINQVTVAGAQMSVRIDFTPHLRLESHLNIQQGRERDPVTGNNHSPTHVPPTFGSTQLSYQRKKFRAMLYANYNGGVEYENLALTERADAHLYARDGEGNPYVPAWLTLNAKASYTFIPQVTVDVGVENIMDQRYRPYSSGITAAGRNFIVALRAKI